MRAGTDTGICVQVIANEKGRTMALSLFLFRVGLFYYEFSRTSKSNGAELVGKLHFLFGVVLSNLINLYCW